MAEEEPMELSGEGYRFFRGGNDSESDMVIDSPVHVSAGCYKSNSPEGKVEYNWFSATMPALNSDKVVTFSSFNQRRSMCNIKLNDPVSRHEDKTVASPMRRLSEPLHVRDRKKYKHEKSDRTKQMQRKKRKEKSEVKEEKTTKQSSRKSLCTYVMVIVCLSGVLLAFLYNANKSCEIDIDMIYLKKAFNDVYGQHIATQTILSLFNEFSVGKRLESNPLVLSFHGWTGVGKNYVTRILVDSFTEKKFNLFLIPLHFGDSSKQHIYQKLIPEWIEGNLTTCAINIFVFDEMDKATEGVLAGLHSLLYKLKHQNQSDTQAIFILLSNSKARKINDLLFSKLSHGMRRTSLQINEFMSLLLKNAEKEWYIDLYRDNLIDVFIPFLPLNDEHVVSCIKNDLARKGRQPTAAFIEAVKKDLLYFRSSNGENYSLTGCKRVSDKVDLHLSD